MEPEEFIQNFLEHQYDPIKAHEYYMRVRQLKGRAGVAKDTRAQSYVNAQVGDAHKKLVSDLKETKVKMNPNRRISAAEQKLIRAKSLASRVKDPTVRADMLAKIAETEKKLHAFKTRLHSPGRYAVKTTKVSHPKTGTTVKRVDVKAQKFKNKSHENQ